MNDYKEKLSKCTYNNTSKFSLKGRKFHAKCVDIYDGDTATFCMFLNTNVYRFNMRLLGIDTPEIRPSKNDPDRDNEKIAANYVKNRFLQLIVDNEIDLNKKYTKKEIRKILENNIRLVTIYCDKFDKYGRCLVKIFRHEDESEDDSKSINNILLNEKLACKYEGGTKVNYKTYFKVNDKN